MLKKIIVAMTILTVLVTGGLLLNHSKSTNQNHTSTTQSSTKASEVVIEAIPSKSSKTQKFSGTYDEADQTTSYDKKQATAITLADQKSSVSGKGATVSGDVVTITNAGTYIFSGKLSNGQIVVNSAEAENIHIILNGVSITNQTTAALAIQKAQKTIITTNKGTENTLATIAKSFSDSDSAEEKAALYSKNDLSLNGTGKLTVSATAGNGIQSKENLKITGGTYTVTSQNEGLKGKNSIQISDGDFTITSDSDGLQTTNTKETNQGKLILDGGNFTIKSETDGIQADQELIINEPTLNINTLKSGNLDNEKSYKGLKAGTNLTINGGTIKIKAADDTIHSNANVTVNGGSFELNSGDDGIHADQTTPIVNGDITITDSCEGIEGSDVIFKGGNINVKASDDGINAGGGSTENEGEATKQGGAFGADQFQITNPEDHTVTIAGGTIVVNAEGDGLDSNGNIKMSGGDVTVFGPVNGGNGALDYDGTFDISGGTLKALGFSDMAQTTSDSSPQASIQIWLDTQLSKNEKIKLTDTQGNLVTEVTAQKAFSNIILSDSKIQNGQTYTATFSSGLTIKIAVSDGVTSVDQNGNAVTGFKGMGEPPMGGGPKF